ncbi:thioesterase II family protein [Nocardia sp. NPDC051052]|uniref:thioesterase II family protein n=1 Tax=Nocardia sp. NPDC051052 TaxID=3364322 RepID=UPI0037BB8421
MADRSQSLWIKRFHPSPNTGIRLACLPHAGGSASYFLPVSKSLARECEVLSVQYPGRQERRLEPCIVEIGELAQRVAAELAEWADQPLAIFGHSMGSVLAFEVTRILEANGIQPVALFVSGRRAPSATRVAAMHLLPDSELIKAIRSMEGTSESLLNDDEMIQLILPTIRSDYRAIESYRYTPSPAISAPIHAFIGDRDPQVSEDEADDWRHHTKSEFTLNVYTGGHFYLNTHAQRVISFIGTILAKEIHSVDR